MAQLNIKVNPMELIKILFFIGALLGFGIPALLKIYKTYDEIHYMWQAFKEAAEVKGD